MLPRAMSSSCREQLAGKGPQSKTQGTQRGTRLAVDYAPQKPPVGVYLDRSPCSSRPSSRRKSSTKLMATTTAEPASPAKKTMVKKRMIQSAICMPLRSYRRADKEFVKKA